jgi:hypothetical protein
MAAKLKPIDMSGSETHDIESEEKFCTNDSCTIPSKSSAA